MAVAGIGVWKLGDIVSSTPRTESTVRLNAYNLPPPAGYSDASYGNDTALNGYIYSSAYMNRGMAYAGANDGMLHAFNLGTLNVTPSANTKATLTGAGLGNEAWTFMPTNVLPYLGYYADPGYGHLYFMDGNTTIVDASVGTCGAGTNYSDCPKDLSGSGSNWRTILVGGMGIGGASSDHDSGCATGNGGTCVRTPISGVGYSSYYALDVTNPNSPKFLWEFSDPGLGFATSGAAIVKISTRTDNKPDKSKNGRWFAVFGSGPTGPINTSHQFLGTSYQPLQVYVVDLNAAPPLQNGVNYWIINNVSDGDTTGPINNAFSGSMVNGSIDTDKWNINALGNYQDEAVYFGYTRKDENAGTWTKGGVLKLKTFEDPNPANWQLVKVLDGTGPITTGIARLQDRKNHNLWLYFGTGRYFFLKDDFVTNPAERLYGVKEPCYTVNDTLDSSCTQVRSMSDLTDQTNADQTVNKGWYISLDGVTTDSNNDTLGGERVITDPSALTNGAVFFTTYEPNNDFCQFGGASYLWAVKYDTGTQAPAAALIGKALVQVSTGEFKQIDLSSVFTDRNNRRMGTAMTGKPPTDPPPIISKSKNKPVKRILHMEEH